jgi:hypothetical protein
MVPMFFYSQEKLNVYFDFDKYDLNEQGVKKINSWIAEGKNYEVTKLYGFCDWKGSNEYNDTLAMKRVYTVYEFLKQSKGRFLLGEIMPTVKMIQERLKERKEIIVIEIMK